MKSAKNKANSPPHYQLIYINKKTMNSQTCKVRKIFRHTLNSHILVISLTRRRTKMYSPTHKFPRFLSSKCNKLKICSL